MSDAKLSALISWFVAVVILFANFKQWWNLTYDGHMITRSWVKVLFSVCLVLLGISLYFLLKTT